MQLNHTLFSSVQEISRSNDSKIIWYNVCIQMPPNVRSNGIGASGNIQESLPTNFAFSVFNLQVLVIFVITQIFYLLLKPFGFPKFVSELMAGFILGPSLNVEALNNFKKILFPFGSEITLASISAFGYVFFLFLNAVQMDFTMITRTGRKSWAIAFLSMVLPGIVFYASLDATVKKMEDTVSDTHQLPPVFIAQNSCSFAVIASLLRDIEILNSELGRLALSSALLSDTISNIYAGVMTAFHNDQGDTVENAIFVTAYLILTPLIFRPAMMWVVKKTPEGRPVWRGYIYVTIFLVVGLGYIAVIINQPFLAGAIVLGFVVPEGPPLGSALVEHLELFTTYFLLPIFVTTSVLKIDISTYYNPLMTIAVISIMAIIYLIKILVCIGVACYCKMPKVDGVVLGLIMGCKGTVDIGSFSILYDHQILTNEVTSVMVLGAVILGTITRVCVKFLYDPSRKYAGYQRRNIMSLRPNSELRIVACIHNPSHIPAIKATLEISCPTTNRPIIVNVLHLMELVGRTSPMFISHSLQENFESGYHNLSGDIIVTFNLFQHNNQGAATANTFTAVSPVSLMHEDICHLALDKVASLIILPFHRRYSNFDGSVISEDNNVRTLNCRVLQKAPCSLGILVCRGYYSSDNKSSCTPVNQLSRVAMIFLGGKDDREALSFAKRATSEPNVSLFVYHLVSLKSEVSNWEIMLDDEVLRDVREDNHHNVTFEEICVDHASQTTSFVSEMANRFDFIIVGRRYGVQSPQTAALLDWSECPELGPVGDLLASPDLETRASILIVQQQQTTK